MAFVLSASCTFWTVNFSVSPTVIAGNQLVVLMDFRGSAAAWADHLPASLAIDAGRYAMSLTFGADGFSCVFARGAFFMLNKVVGQHVEFQALFVNPETFVATAKHEINDLFAFVWLGAGFENYFSERVVQVFATLYQLCLGIATGFGLDADFGDKLQ